ncbi:hypothetical protein PaG_03088 [Moesziomyces aphidis]|uniref:Uncharacterized protein n=1 Tax=Moesziomyces aphidis TaxID=84754 RepID=W3VLC9_MOEAP|nr:hypothetical protein PaG_03088 [Moesziomyces aphidis]
MSFASFAPLPAPSSGASSIWARRMITKSVPTSDAEVELNVLSLLLDVPLAALDEHELATSPVALHTPASPWAPSPVSDMGFAHASPLSLEMHAAQTAVKAALDVLEEPSLSRGLRISTAMPAAAGGRGCLTAPLSPALSSPVSPAESCFSTADEGLKKKGRARMSQEKRKRLARRREREALVATLGPSELHFLPHSSHSAPVTPVHSSFTPHAFGGFPFGAAYDTAPRDGLAYDMPSPALTTASLAASSAACSTPASSPTALAPVGDANSSPPTLVVQPPSPQRHRLHGLGRPKHAWTGFAPTHLASVF